MKRAAAAEERLCLGSHLSVAGGAHRAVEEAIALGLASLQIFTKNASRWVQRAMREDEVAQFRAARARWGEHAVVSHESYLFYLASADGALRKRSRAAFIDELERAEQLGLDAVVTHPGAHMGSGPEKGIDRFAAELRAVFDAVPFVRTRVLIECTAGQGTVLGRSFAELAGILAAVACPARLGVCLDTCHLFAAGYDLRRAAGYEAAMRELEREIGAREVRCWHLNDSRGALGSHLDRHEHIGKGQIGASGFRALLADARFDGIPKILETPKENDMDRVNLRALRRLARPARSASPRR
ncbi:MAG: deoxyribonuclease IV [Planctomycetes bacterium]|nr:deoxyribonuclease IV [Planctomycetota bacterium]